MNWSEVVMWVMVNKTIWWDDDQSGVVLNGLLSEYYEG